MKRTFVCLALLALLSLVGCCGPQEGKTQNVVAVFMTDYNGNNYTVMIMDPETKELTAKRYTSDVTLVMDVSPGEPMWLETKDGKTRIHIRQDTIQGGNTGGKHPQQIKRVD